MVEKKPNFTVSGIPVFLHWSILPMLAYLLLANMGGKIPLLPLITFPVLLIIVTLHEFGHCLAARALGSSVKKITLTAIGGLAEIGSMRITWKEAVITAAGPLVNVIIAIIGLPLIWGKTISEDMLTNFSLGNTAALLWILNLIILIFNLLPIYPMDGGRLWRCLLAAIAGEKKSYQFIQVTNTALLIGVAWFSILEGTFLMLAIVALMAIVGISSSKKEVKKYKFEEKLGKLIYWKLLKIEPLVYNSEVLQYNPPDLNIATLQNLNNNYTKSFIIGVCGEKLYQILTPPSGANDIAELVVNVAEMEKELGIEITKDLQELIDLDTSQEHKTL